MAAFRGLKHGHQLQLLGSLPCASAQNASLLLSWLGAARWFANQHCALHYLASQELVNLFFAADVGAQFRKSWHRLTALPDAFNYKECVLNHRVAGKGCG